MTSVFELLPPPLQRSLDEQGFSEPTPIQSQTIKPLIEGCDVMGIAQTGTGKTAAFVLPILHHLITDPRKGVRALILCPTRELAVQVADSVGSLAKHTTIKHVAVFGGVGQGPQVQALRAGANILIATPGRLMDLYEQGHIKFDTIDYFVLDEADRMLDMGFINDIKKVSKQIPQSRQTLFFSATMSETVKKLANSLLKDPRLVEVGREAQPIEKIEQRVLFVDKDKKVDLLLHLLSKEHLDKVLIFARTKRGADRLCKTLKKHRVSAQQIHGDRTQSQRTKALDAFAKGSSRCLVATDVAARGIDIQDISHVINYDLPDDAENYVHRIGRTARAGAAGVAYSFCSVDDMPLLKAVFKSIGARIEHEDHKFHSEAARNSKVVFTPKRRGGGGRPRKPSFADNRSRRKGGSKRGASKRSFSKKRRK